MVALQGLGWPCHRGLALDFCLQPLVTVPLGPLSLSDLLHCCRFLAEPLLLVSLSAAILRWGRTLAFEDRRDIAAGDAHLAFRIPGS